MNRPLSDRETFFFVAFFALLSLQAKRQSDTPQELNNLGLLALMSFLGLIKHSYEAGQGSQGSFMVRLLGYTALFVPFTGVMEPTNTLTLFTIGSVLALLAVHLTPLGGVATSIKPDTYEPEARSAEALLDKVFQQQGVRPR